MEGPGHVGVDDHRPEDAEGDERGIARGKEDHREATAWGHAEAADPDRTGAGGSSPHPGARAGEGPRPA